VNTGLLKILEELELYEQLFLAEWVHMEVCSFIENFNLPVSSEFNIRVYYNIVKE
jgi:hypothetical protein